MNDTSILKFYTLPTELRKEVTDFIEFLLQKYQQEKMPLLEQKRPSNFGSAKGLITMSDDFNAPLEELLL
jgi:Protein of unknown function (DUF2281)